MYNSEVTASCKEEKKYGIKSGYLIYFIGYAILRSFLSGMVSVEYTANNTFYTGGLLVLFSCGFVFFLGMKNFFSVSKAAVIAISVTILLLELHTIRTQTNGDIDLLYGLSDTACWIVISSFGSLAYILMKRIKDNFPGDGMRIMVVAAKHAGGYEGGFTNRPYPAGNIKLDIVKGFALYLQENKIVSHIEDEEGIRFIISYNTSRFKYIKYKRYENLTWVKFSNSGNISVHIAEEDYKRHKNKITFDGMCDSLADMFKRFYGYYESSRAEEIKKYLTREQIEI